MEHLEAELEGLQDASIARRSSKASTARSCAGDQRPSSWRVTSARTLAGAGCDGVLAWPRRLLDRRRDEARTIGVTRGAGARCAKQLGQA
jgi:hypothetical protein